MNVEKNSNTVSSKKQIRKTWCAKSAALSFSLMLGACATTGDKLETEAEPKQNEVVKASSQAQNAAPEPSAAELMKTLKAPLVEPPETKISSASPEMKKPESEKVIAAEAEELQQKSAVEQSKVVKRTKKLDPETETAAQVVTKTPATAEVKTVPKPQQASQTVVVEKAEGVAKSNVKPFNVSASKLPFSYDIWTIRKGNTPLTQGLVIVTPTWEMGKEGYMSQIWFTMMEDAIHVNSSSDIEPASKGLGIRIDGGELIPFTSIAENNIGVISGKWLDQLAAADKIDVYLGFFPGKKPRSDTFASDLSLNNLARMVATYRMLSE